MKKAFVVTTFIGTLALDEENKVIGFRPIEEIEIAEKIIRSEGEVIEEENELMDELKEKGFGRVQERKFGRS